MPDDHHTSDEGGAAYRWTCPACGTTNRGVASQKAPLTSAIEALRSHIRVSDERGHGPAYELPDRWDCETLKSHIDIGER